MAMFKAFLAFVDFLQWDLHQMNVFSLLCFLECLQLNGVKHTQMSNYLSAIKSKFSIFGPDVSDGRLKLYQRAIQLHAHLMLNSIKPLIYHFWLALQRGVNTCIWARFIKPFICTVYFPSCACQI